MPVPFLLDSLITITAHDVTQHTIWTIRLDNFSIFVMKSQFCGRFRVEWVDVTELLTWFYDYVSVMDQMQTSPVGQIIRHLIHTD